MKTASEIRNEINPFLREIWAAGYDLVKEDPCTDSMILYCSDNGKEKLVSRMDILPHNFSIMKAVLIDGREHRWIKEGDGSAERFRKLIS